MKTTIILDQDQIRAIRHALLLGLDSYGEIQRLAGEGVAVLEPSADSLIIQDFVAALRMLENHTEK